MIELDNWRYFLHFRLKFYLSGKCLSLLGFPHSLGFHWLSPPSQVLARANLRNLMVLGEVRPVLLLSSVTHCIYYCEGCPPAYSVLGLSHSRTQSTGVYGICKYSMSTDNRAYFIHSVNISCAPGAVIDALDIVATMTRYLPPKCWSLGGNGQ